ISLNFPDMAALQLPATRADRIGGPWADAISGHASRASGQTLVNSTEPARMRTMGTHGGASTRLRAREADERAKTSTASRPRISRAFTLPNWPVSWRLFAVFMLTLALGLVFGGLRVASAADSAAQLNRVSQLAGLGQQITVLTQALEDERDKTCGNVGNAGALQHWYDATDAAAAK